MSNGNGHSWSKFAWRDWSADKALHPCSLAARGFWIEMLCIMHEGTPVGHLTLGGKAATIRQLAANAYCSEKEATKHLAELEAAGVFSRTTDGIIYSRRMVKDDRASEQARLWGKTGGNPTLNGKEQTSKKQEGGLTPPIRPALTQTLTDPLNPPLNSGVNAKNLESEKEKESLSSSYLLKRGTLPAPAREAEPPLPLENRREAPSPEQISEVAAKVAALTASLKMRAYSPGRGQILSEAEQRAVAETLPRFTSKPFSPEQLATLRRRAGYGKVQQLRVVS